MIYTIENEFLHIQADTKGAQLLSFYSKKTQTEYLWQGDAKYWSGRAYNLFPFIGRMFQGVFTYANETYPSKAHGLARYLDFVLEEQTESRLTFLLVSNEETKKEYPFDFEFRVIFEISENELTTRYTVKNTDNRTLICAFGGHPGINVPFGKGTFEEYYLEFDTPTPVRRQLLSNLFMANKTEPYPLENGTKMPLRHDLFDNDAVILENTSSCVRVKCDKEDRFVEMRYEDFPFIGFWHAVETDAPYVCLEPWSALPSVDGELTALESKPNMTHVPVGESASKAFVMKICE